MSSKFSIFVITTFFLCSNVLSQTSIMTFNIRYDNPNDNENNWHNRKYEIVEMINSYQPSIFGLQEAMNHQLKFINEQFPNYSFIGFGRDGKGKISEAVPIFYDETKYQLIESETFWLSETPDTVSVGWDAALPRIATYGAFANLNDNDTLHVFNTHFDHMGRLARENSAKLILDKIVEYKLGNKQLIVMGDFNCVSSDLPYKTLTEYLKDASSISLNKPIGPTGTWNAFDISMDIATQIDYVFVKNLSVNSYKHINQRRKNNLHLSDHLPVLIEIDYPELKSSNIITISRDEYYDKLQGFWLGINIANWTGLVTEMDKIGNIGEIKTGDFYTSEDWLKPDQPSIWGEGLPSNLSEKIDFVFRDTSEVWGSDDDTDIEYMYQHLLYSNKTSILTAEQIRDGWLKHIREEEENYLWVSNQKAFELMLKGMLPPATGDPVNNPEFEMIDAQLTTEIFGLFAPARPDIALKMAKLPIQTTARFNAEWAAQFYVYMYSLASLVDETLTMQEKTLWMADEARKVLPDSSYSAKMFDFVKSGYAENIKWEHVRDEVYEKYQVNQEDGYNITSQNLYCNGCFASGINFAASIISLLYGEGDLQETIKIGALAGWDSDNPTATWGGLLGFMYGKEKIETTFNRKFSNRYNIHRTRQNFPNNGINTFENMAEVGLKIIDRVVKEEMGGKLDSENNFWYIPLK
jgi:endonuclease/exonuclease/phosphatase family metal-dependent hydrolase